VSEDAHRKAISHLLSSCKDLAVLSVLAYGSYARGDYKPESDIDLLVVLDSKRYSSKDMKSLIDICKFCKKEFNVLLQMDIWTESEIELWNKGILLDGHSFVDLSFYNKDGKVLFGRDIRNRFRLPTDIEKKACVLLDIIETEFKRWFFQQESESRVPHWMTGWLLVTFLNTLGIADVAGFKETCASIKQIPVLAGTPGFQKYEMERELEPDEFIRLYRVIKSEAQTRRKAEA